LGNFDLLLSIFWLLVELGCISVCLATLAGFLGRISWVLDLFSHFRFQYLVLLALATILFIAGGRYPQALLSGLFAGLNLSLILPLYSKEFIQTPSNPGRSDQKMYRILLTNVLQMNDAYGAVRHLIRSERPDFIVLIEVNKIWIDQLKPVLESYPFSRMSLREDNYGIALFSRIPPTFSEVRAFGAAQVPSIITTFNLRQRPLTILTTHPPPPKTKQKAHLRNIQLAEVAEYVKTLEGEVLLVGDLNMTSWSPFFSDLVQKSDLRDSRRGFGIQNSWPTNRRLFMIPIDHILVSKGVEVLSRRIGQFNGSDHYPILLDFYLIDRNVNAQSEKKDPINQTINRSG
jgi:endonuclease/exonuclease/phosphatase (EEP) superfamily protein YafD